MIESSPAEVARAASWPRRRAALPSPGPTPPIDSDFFALQGTVEGAAKFGRGIEAFWVSQAAKDAFGQFGWREVRDVLHSPLPSVVRKVGSRDNCWIDLHLDGQSGRTRCYLKRHRESRFWSWLGSLASLRRWTPSGMAEAFGVLFCERAGVPAMKLVACGSLLGRHPWQAESFFMSGAVNGIPADDFWKRHCSGATSGELRSAALAAMARTARAFHGAKLFHQDFYWCHFFLERRDDGCVARLIDLQRVRRRPLFEMRWLVKDLGQFYFSMPPDVTEEEKQAWFREYFSGGHFHSQLLYAVVRIRAWFYRLREAMRAH